MFIIKLSNIKDLSCANPTTYDRTFFLARNNNNNNNQNLNEKDAALFIQYSIVDQNLVNLIIDEDDNDFWSQPSYPLNTFRTLSEQIFRQLFVVSSNIIKTWKNCLTKFDLIIEENQSCIIKMSNIKVIFCAKPTA